MIASTVLNLYGGANSSMTCTWGTVTDSTTEAQPQRTDSWLAEILVGAGLISKEFGQELLADTESVWSAAVRRGWVTDDIILQVLSNRFSIQIVDFGEVEPRATAFVPESLARKHFVIPIKADDHRIRVATSDPRNIDVEQVLEFVTGRTIDYRLASPTEVAERLDDLYRPDKSVNRLLSGLMPTEIEQIEDKQLLGTEILEAPMTKLVDAMIGDAVREGASDIHSEPVEGIMSIRYRIDGVLREVMRLPGTAGPALVRRIKILAKLDVTDPLHPHDGRAAVRVDGGSVDLRVSTVPIARKGEKAVIRILNKSNLRGTIADLRLPPEEEDVFQRLVSHRDGMLLVTGPTGSGKTTTLYAVLNQLRTGKVNIVTIEDPVEYEIDGISQLQVNEDQDFTFASALRSVLRQDPDIVLVGEIRDGETANIAIQAGQTGHFVLSTLHTNDAPSSIPRLRDLGADGFNIASVLRGVLAQRLVRKLCMKCCEPLSIEDLPPEARPPEGHTAAPRQAKGCQTCGGTGYRGRMAILEIMPVDERVAQLIESGAMPDVLAEAAAPLGMRSLWQSALDRVWRGQTSIEEVQRVLGDRAGDDCDPNAVAPLVLSTAPPGHGTVPDDTREETTTPDSAAPPTPETAPERMRILVADDDDQMRKLVRMILKRDGFEIEEAKDGLDALDMLERHQFDLLILDMDMPRLDGLGVLEELRARVMTSSLPVIVLTARVGDGEVRALDLGAQDYLNKPVQPASLAARVKAVLRRSRI